MQILVVEDDNRISNFLVKGLEECGYLVTLCKNAEDVLKQYINIEWDLIILDIMLADMDGVQLLQALRYKKVYTPILMLSALNSVQDKISALDYGADDYLTKPFHFDELISRIRALTRRRQYEQLEIPKAELQFGQLHINRAACRAISSRI
jgi:two-component system OmpR family response regulator